MYAVFVLRNYILNGLPDMQFIPVTEIGNDP